VRIRTWINPARENTKGWSVVLTTTNLVIRDFNIVMSRTREVDWEQNRIISMLVNACPRNSLSDDKWRFAASLDIALVSALRKLGIGAVDWAWCLIVKFTNGDRHLSILVIHRGDLIDEMFYERRAARDEEYILWRRLARAEVRGKGRERKRKRERERGGGGIGYRGVNLIM